MSAVNLVNDTAALRYYSTGRKVLDGTTSTPKDIDRTCRDATLGELYYHYGSLMNTMGDYHHAERCFKKALPLTPNERPDMLLFVQERLYDSQKHMVGHHRSIEEHITGLRELLNFAHKNKAQKAIAHLECKLADGLLNKRSLNDSDTELLLQYSRSSAELYKRIYGESHFRYVQSVTTYSRGLIRAWRLDEAKESLSVAETSFNNSGNLQHSTHGYWAVSKAHFYIAKTFRTSSLKKKKFLYKEALVLLASSYNDTVRTLRYNHPEAAATMLAISYLYVRRAIWKENETRGWLLKMAFHTFRIAARLRRRQNWPLPCCDLKFPCPRTQWFVLEERLPISFSQASSGYCTTGRKRPHAQEKSTHKLQSIVHRFH